MEDDADDVKDDLRTELFMLLQDLKRLEYVGVDDVAEFLSTTRALAAELQIPKLRKFIARMQTVKASLMPELTQDQSPGGGRTSKTKRRRDQEDAEPDQDAEPDRDGGGGRASQTKRHRDQEDAEPDQKDAEPDRDGGRGARAPKNSAQIEQRYRREGPSGYESPDRSRAPLEKKKGLLPFLNINTHFLMDVRSHPV